MFFPVFFNNVAALIHNTSKNGGVTAVYLADGRVKYFDFTPETLRKRYYSLFKNERGS